MKQPNSLWKMLLTIPSLLIVALGLARGEELAVGADAPKLVCQDQDGKEVKLADAYAKGLTLFFFYPKANTPGCTKQACSLRDGFADLEKKSVKVYGVSFDDVASQKKFQGDHKLPYSLLADPEGKIVSAFGVPAKGKYASRQAYLVKDGKIAWRSLQASTDKQAADVMKALEELGQK